MAIAMGVRPSSRVKMRPVSCQSVPAARRVSSCRGRQSERWHSTNAGKGRRRGFLLASWEWSLPILRQSTRCRESTRCQRPGQRLPSAGPSASPNRQPVPSRNARNAESQRPGVSVARNRSPSWALQSPGCVADSLRGFEPVAGIAADTTPADGEGERAYGAHGKTLEQCSTLHGAFGLPAAKLAVDVCAPLRDWIFIVPKAD